MSGRHVFDVVGPVQWPTDPTDSTVFSSRQSASIFDRGDRVLVGDTKVAVIFDPEGKEFAFQFEGLELGKKHSMASQTESLARHKERVAKSTSPEERKQWEEMVRSDEIWMARGQLDRRFDLGLPDSLGVWEFKRGEIVDKDDKDSIRNQGQIMTAYVYRKPWLHIFQQPRGPATEQPANEARMRAFLKRFRTRAEFEIPREPGLCIPYGFIADDGTLPFAMKQAMRYRDVPGVIYVLDTGVVSDKIPSGGGALWNAMGVAGIGLLGGEVPENMEVLQRIGPKKVQIDGRVAIESGVVARVNGLDAEEKRKASARADYTPAQLKRILNRAPYEVYTLYAGTNGKRDSQALPWLDIKMRTFARNQVTEEEKLASDPPPFAQSLPRFEGLLHSMRLRATTPALPEVEALGKGYGAAASNLDRMYLEANDDQREATMRGVIRLRDRTDHGGHVETASSTMIIDGMPAALVGDLVSCPRSGHGTTSIMPGDGSIFSDNKQVALHGFKAGCGCSLISSTTGFGE